MKQAIIYLAALSIIFINCNKEKCKESPCKSGCPTIYEPVCGCNNKTYGNNCEAECSGITDYTYGECK
jgi:hypothetical protein